MTVLHPPLVELGELADSVGPCHIEVARALATLADDWTVFVRPRLGLERPDFVAAHERFGICVIAVVDWTGGTRRRSAEGFIELHEIDGSSRRIPEPRFEAARARTAIYDRCFSLPGDPAEPNDTVRAAVVAPRCTTATARDLIIHAVAPPAERCVRVWGGDALANDIDEIVGSGASAPPSPASFERFLSCVVPAAGRTGRDRSSPSTSSLAPPLTPTQREIAENPLDRSMRRVRGGAGCGKSVALAARAAHLAARGKQVLVLSFNVTMANHLRELVSARSHEYGADPTAVTCANFHSFCEQVVGDAGQLGIEGQTVNGMRFADSIVAMAMHVYRAGFERRYDAVLVDEGQDYSVAWWYLLREHVVTPDGEMLLAVDPQQDLYGRSVWADEDRTHEAGLTEPWIELTGSMRMPSDVTALAKEFVGAHVFGVPASNGSGIDDPAARDGVRVPGPRSIGRWQNINGVNGLGREIGREVVRLLHEHPELAPRDVVFLCEYHHDGEAAAAEIEAAGYAVHHLFSRDPDDPRRGRRYRLWPGADAVTGCTVHSFKGWTTRALVMGIGVETRSKGAAYTSMTRVGSDPGGGPSFLSIVNADHRLVGFGAAFTSALPESAPTVNAWDPPPAHLRVG